MGIMFLGLGKTPDKNIRRDNPNENKVHLQRKIDFETLQFMLS